MRIHKEKERPVYVVVSLDVEEEGLFSGRYRATGLGVKNVSLLPRLAPLSRDLGFPLTLFCSHAALSRNTSRKTLAFMRDELGAEIGAHLHHWSTPPFPDGLKDAPGEPERTHCLPLRLLEDRLDALLGLGRDFNGRDLTSFRMGRWDLKAHLRPLLASRGILVDSSVCPLRSFAKGPDHFLAPADPYWAPESPGLLEAPITQVPLSPALAAIWRLMNRKATERLDRFHFFGALSPNPVWHALPVMRLATRLHMLRGGQVLSLFWHSSEMLPGASPATPDWQASARLVRKISAFLSWLKDSYPVAAVTASQLAALARSGKIDATIPPGPCTGDW